MNTEPTRGLRLLLACLVGSWLLVALLSSVLWYVIK